MRPSNANAKVQRTEFEGNGVGTAVLKNSVSLSFHSIYFGDLFICKFIKKIGAGVVWLVSIVNGPLNRVVKTRVFNCYRDIIEPFQVFRRSYFVSRHLLSLEWTHH